MAVWDCAMVFNELDLLELRLNELRDVVDHFVLVESPITHSGKEKPLHYWQNRDRFREFPIIHIVATDFPDTPHSWATVRHPTNPLDWTRENYQRDAILSGLAEADDNDVILVSDLDEIPRATAVQACAENLAAGVPFLVFEMRHFYYYMDLLADERHTALVTRGILRKNLTTPTELRWLPGGDILPKAGWHFSWLGGVPKIIEKIEAFAHQELNQPTLKDPSYLELCLHARKTIHQMKSLIRVPFDHTYPQYLVQNHDRFRQYLSPEGLPGLAGP